MSDEKIPSEAIKVEQYRLQTGNLLQLITILIGFISSNPISDATGYDSNLILLVIAFLSIGVYFIPYFQSSQTNATHIPSYWNSRIVSTAQLGSMYEYLELNPSIYLSALEIQYQTALYEGKMELANRFRELIYEVRDQKEKIKDSSSS